MKDYTRIYLKERKIYFKIMSILCLPMLYIICLYLYTSRQIEIFLYPGIVLLIVILSMSLYAIYKLFYGDHL